MEVPMICQLIANFCKNLRMQFIFSNPSHATHRPGLEGFHDSYRADRTREDPATTVLPREIAFVGFAYPASSTLHLWAHTASPGLLPPSDQPASPTLGPHAVPSHSWMKVVARRTLPVGSSPSSPYHPLSDPANAWSPAESRSR